jgi:hypothetical protein
MQTLLEALPLAKRIRTAALPYDRPLRLRLNQLDLYEIKIGQYNSCVRQVQQFGHGGWVVPVEKLLRQSRP